MSTDPPLWTAADADLDRPNTARICDYCLGGSHNFAADRHAADAVLTVVPEITTVVRANRAFLGRAVRFALGCGIRQFLDLGSGIPTPGGVHTIARNVEPTTRVLYVDGDPVVTALATAVLAGTDAAGVVYADIRDIPAIVGHTETRRVINFDEPIAVLLLWVLHFIGGDLTDTLGALRKQMTVGSLLTISHTTVGPDPQSAAVADAITQLYARTCTPVHLRTRDEAAELFTGLDLLPAGPGAGERLAHRRRQRPQPPRRGSRPRRDGAQAVAPPPTGTGTRPRSIR
jgi:hypothetical protein